MDHCERVNCSSINISVCTPVQFLPYEPLSYNSSEIYLSDDELSYDEEGCFYTDRLRRTYRYETYLKFSLCMGILTIGRENLTLLRIKLKNFLREGFKKKEKKLRNFPNLPTPLLRKKNKNFML